ncbi:Uncharacterised protein [Streptococcus pneumoniae]|nr:Uncharacterised protein [Streptococcus pneumoniae]
MTFGAKPSLPPKTSAMAWWPKQIPRIGFLPAKSRIMSSIFPASTGQPGPGEKTRPSAFSASSYSLESSFLRT